MANFSYSSDNVDSEPEVARLPLPVLVHALEQIRLEIEKLDDVNADT